MTTQWPTQNDPNPRRVQAGTINRQKRQYVTEEGRERLRQNAIQHQPWTASTGPRTEAGKVRSAANGKIRQRGSISVRQMRADLKAARKLVRTVKQFVAKLRSNG